MPGFTARCTSTQRSWRSSGSSGGTRQLGAGRRARLAHEDVAVYQCDAFTGNFATTRGEGKRRSDHYRRIDAAAPDVEPGGWSVWGQACDQVNNHFRRRSDACKDIGLGYTSDLTDRPRYEDLRIGTQGVITRRPTAELVIDAAIYGWFGISRACFERSWIVTGMVDKEEMVRANKYPSMAHLDRRLEQATAMLKDPLEINHALAFVTPAVSDVLSRPLPGEVKTFRKFEGEPVDGKPLWHVLPKLLVRPLQKELAAFEQQRDDLEGAALEKHLAKPMRTPYAQPSPGNTSIRKDISPMTKDCR